MDKSADAFRTISEVADDLDVPKHVLRFWEIRFPQIKPMKRGGGRRYYRPADMELLRGIRHLLHNEGYTIKGVQKILREQGVETVKNSAQDSVGAATGRSVVAEPAPVAAPTKRRGAAATATARGRAKPAALPRDRKAALAMLVRELEAARTILAGEPAAQAKPAARARARR